MAFFSGVRLVLGPCRPRGVGYGDLRCVCGASVLHRPRQRVTGASRAGGWAVRGVGLPGKRLAPSRPGTPPPLDDRSPRGPPPHHHHQQNHHQNRHHHRHHPRHQPQGATPAMPMTRRWGGRGRRPSGRRPGGSSPPCKPSAPPRGPPPLPLAAPSLPPPPPPPPRTVPQTVSLIEPLIATTLVPSPMTACATRLTERERARRRGGARRGQTATTAGAPCPPPTGAPGLARLEMPRPPR